MAAALALLPLLQTQTLIAVMSDKGLESIITNNG